MMRTEMSDERSTEGTLIGEYMKQENVKTDDLIKVLRPGIHALWYASGIIRVEAGVAGKLAIGLRQLLPVC